MCRTTAFRSPVSLNTASCRSALVPSLQDRVHVLDRLAALQLVDHVVHELEQLERELPHRHFGALAEVDQLAVDAPTAPRATCSPR